MKLDNMLSPLQVHRSLDLKRRPHTPRLLHRDFHVIGTGFAINISCSITNHYVIAAILAVLRINHRENICVSMLRKAIKLVRYRHCKVTTSFICSDQRARWHDILYFTYKGKNYIIVAGAYILAFACPLGTGRNYTL